jgi:hypothetical protein
MNLKIISNQNQSLTAASIAKQLMEYTTDHRIGAMIDLMKLPDSAQTIAYYPTLQYDYLAYGLATKSKVSVVQEFAINFDSSYKEALAHLNAEDLLGNIQFIDTTIDKLIAPESSFDAITLINLYLLFTPKEEEAIHASALKLVKPGGYLLFGNTMGMVKSFSAFLTSLGAKHTIIDAHSGMRSSKQPDYALFRIDSK